LSSIENWFIIERPWILGLQIRDHKPLSASFALFTKETKTDSDRKSGGN